MLRDTGGGSFTVVGVDTHSTPNPVPDVISFTVASPIAVAGGEILGLYDASTNLACYFHGGDTPLTDALIALHPTTPTANQVLNLNDSSGGGYTLNLEATLTPPASRRRDRRRHQEEVQEAQEEALSLVGQEEAL